MSKFSEKLQRSAFKNLLIAKDKQGEVRAILKNDVTTFKFLYDRDFLTKSEKSQMVDGVKALVFEEQTDLLSEPNFSATLQQDSFSLISCPLPDHV
jgi:hypothetical protein